MARITIHGGHVAKATVVASMCLLLAATRTFAASALECSSPMDPLTALRSETWPNPTNISSSPDTDSDTPALVVTSCGTLHVVWEEGDEVYHSYREGSSWSTPSRVSTGEQPSLAVGPDDTVHLVFVNEIADVYNIYYTRWEGTDWDKPARKVSDTSSFPDSPHLAIATDGQRHLVWTEDGHVYYGDSVDGVIWAYGPFAGGSAPTVGIDENSTVLAAWQSVESVNYEVYFSSLEDGSWDPPQNVSDSPSSDSTAPDLTVQADGTPHLAWQEVISETPQVRYSRGPGWSQKVTLSDSSSGGYIPSLVVDAWGGRHAAWADFQFPYYRVRYTHARAADSAWESPTTLALSASLSQQLEQVCLYPGPDGAIHAVWVATEGGKGEVLCASHQFPHILLPLALRQAGG